MNMNIYEGVNVSEIICSYEKDVIIAQNFCKTVLVLHIRAVGMSENLEGGGGGVIWWT